MKKLVIAVAVVCALPALAAKAQYFDAMKRAQGLESSARASSAASTRSEPTMRGTHADPRSATSSPQATADKTPARSETKR